MSDTKLVRVWHKSEYGEHSNIEVWPVFTDEELKNEMLDLLDLYTKEEIEAGISLYIKHIDESNNPVFDKGIDTDGLTVCEVIENIKQGLYDINSVFNITTANVKIPA